MAATIKTITFLLGVKLNYTAAGLSRQTTSGLPEIVKRNGEKLLYYYQVLLESIPPSFIEKVPLTKEVIELRNEYIAAGILGAKWVDDATHVAAATVARADAIASWNFAHIVRLDKMKAYNQVNLINGYGIITIITPKEVHYDET